MTALESGQFDAIVLAGGRSTRFGAPKERFVYQGTPLAERAARAAASAGAGRVVLVGPTLVDAGVLITAHGPVEVVSVRERPEFGGPVAAVGAALPALRSDAPWVLLLACDLARPDAVVAALQSALAGVPAEASGVCLDDGRPQWLAAAYRVASLTAAVAEFARTSPLTNAAMRDVVGGLALVRLPVDARIVQDFDTPADVADFDSHI
ncbi:MAG TPA: NTP transferase domain-containing protein [Candidatus Lumbricidophila sp.]|nr:NTP transferase domain-containing protein [Candidatus Lumbricidophila sp.]